MSDKVEGREVCIATSGCISHQRCTLNGHHCPKGIAFTLPELEDLKKSIRDEALEEAATIAGNAPCGSVADMLRYRKDK